MTLVRETSDGWEVVAEKTRVYSTQVEALDAALPLVTDGRTKAVILHDPDTGKPNGAWRWLDVAGTETEPLRGARIDAQTIDEVVADLNASPKAEPIDGGAGSFEHGTEILGGDTLANGWAHWAVAVERADGTRHAAARAEVVPEVNREVASGRLAFISIGIRFKSLSDDGAMRGARWSSAAFTNKPGVKTLDPSPSVRTEGDALAVRTYSLGDRRQETRSMTKKNLRAHLAPLALRGAAVDKVIAAAALFGVTPEEEFAAEQYESPTVSKFCAIRTAALAEKILEGVPAAEGAAARSAMNAAMRSTLGLRAEVADDVLAAMHALMKACGLAPDADAAAINAAAEKMKPAEKAPEGETMTEKKTEEVAARSEIEKAVLSRIAKLEADHERTALRSHVEHEFAKAKATPSDLDSLVTDLLAVPASSPVRAKLLSLSIRSAVGAPPAARPLPAAGSVDVTSESTALDDATDAEIDAELVAVRAEFPKDPKHHQWARARKRALAKKNGR